MIDSPGGGLQEPQSSPPPPRHPSLPPLSLLSISQSFPSLCVHPFHPLILLLLFSSSIPRSLCCTGFCLISLPVHPIARSARPTLPARRGGVRPRRPALRPSPARREERRGKEQTSSVFKRDFCFRRLKPASVWCQEPRSALEETGPQRRGGGHGGGPEQGHGRLLGWCQHGGGQHVQEQ